MNLNPVDLVERLDAALARRSSHKRRGPGLPPPNPERPIGTDCLPEIRHIVVLMMENHSYDNYLGTLERGDGFGSATPTATNPTIAGAPVAAHRLLATTQQVGVPTQAWPATHEQFADGRNDGFVRSAERQNQKADPTVAMGYWTEQDLPFYHSLARTFPLADRWFSSCLGPTFPNRRFLIAGTAHGLTTDSVRHTFDFPANGTIFDLFAEHRISWANYHPTSHVKPVFERLFGVHGLRARRGIGKVLTSGSTPSPNAAKGPESFLQFTADAYPFGLFAYLGHVRSVDRFLAAAAGGTLPAVSIVDPDFHRSSEENPQDIQAGEAFAARIINAVLQGKDWLGTLLIWVYDEHGGYFDHVPPPVATEPDDCPPDDSGPWRYDRYGFRVPAVIVSPYARPDYVSHRVHDHTSILKLIETKWNLPPLTLRDAEADDLLDALDFSGPPCFAKPPALQPPALGEA